MQVSAADRTPPDCPPEPQFLLAPLSSVVRAAVGAGIGAGADHPESAAAVVVVVVTALGSTSALAFPAAVSSIHLGRRCRGIATAWSRLTVEVRALKGRPRGASPHIPSFRTLAGPSSTPLSQMLRTRPRFGPTRRVHASPLAQLWGLPEDCTAIFRHRVAHRTDNTISTLFFLVDSSFPLLQDTLKIPEVRLQD
eukprot:GGOE01026920.1.p2 GENE.GGOE01026920.1~~GGOE01026920.1.p2  ORF type:complete len:195 (-),score=7.59 GGOE01026920.1:223-807(-)